jgi:hypothetical protein
LDVRIRFAMSVSPLGYEISLRALDTSAKPAALPQSLNYALKRVWVLPRSVSGPAL